MLITVILGFSFVYIQFIEYSFSEFTISDSVLGSVFYLTTGLHAIHVIIGALFLAISTVRIYLDQVTVEHNLGYTFAIYYYHLVDVIWLMVYFVYYYWGA
jgi:heme/copper-type cytochrome/quinol oxidase subunit 3